MSGAIRLRGLIAALWLALVCLAAAPASARAAGVVTGVVVDPLGAAVAGAAVTLLRDSVAVTAVRTDPRGAFEIAAPDAGRYTLRVHADGFLDRTLEPFFVASSGRVVADVSLSIGIAQSVLVTASATETAESRVGAPVTVLDRNTLDVLPTPNVGQALRLVPGTTLSATGARGATTSLFVRGGNANFNKVVIDGVPANDIGGAFDFGDLSTNGIERVEVLRDANSVLYGVDALSGVVDLSTARGRTRVPELRYSGNAGSFGTTSHDVTFGGAANRVSYFAGVSSFDTDNELANNAYRNRTVVGRLDYAAAGRTDLAAVVHHGTAHAGVPNAFPFFGISDDSTRANDATLFSLSAETRATDRLTTTVRVATIRSNYHTVNPTPTGEPFDPFGFGANYLGQEVTIHGANGYSTTGQAVMDFGDVYPVHYDATTTRNSVYGQATYRATAQVSLSAGGRAEHEDGSSKSSSSGTEQSSVRNNGGGFFEAQVTRGRVVAIAGLGVEHNAVFGTVGMPRVSLAGYLRAPSSGAIGETKVTLNAGKGIKAPRIDQELSSLYDLVQPVGLPVSQVGPERSRGFDFGVEQAWMDGRVRTRAAFFDNTFSDLIEFLSQPALISIGVPADVAKATAFGAYVNASSYDARGIELSMDAHATDFSLSAAYTFLDAEVTQSFTGSALAPAENPAFPGVQIGAFAPLVGARPFRRPVHSGSVIARYSHRAVAVTLAGSFAGKQDDSTFLSDAFFGSSMLLPNHNLDAAYQKIDIFANYRLHPRFSWYAAIENVVGKRYESAAGYPSLPRTFQTGITVSLGGDRRP